MGNILCGYNFNEIIDFIINQPSFTTMVERVKNSRTTLFIGNGGNMAVANHMASDISRYLKKSTLVPDVIHLTALGGDNQWVKPYVTHTLESNPNIDLIIGITSRTTSPIYTTLRDLEVPSSILLMAEPNHSDDIHVPVEHLHLFETACLLALYSIVQNLRVNFP